MKCCELVQQWGAGEILMITRRIAGTGTLLLLTVPHSARLSIIECDPPPLHLHPSLCCLTANRYNQVRSSPAGHGWSPPSCLSPVRAKQLYSNCETFHNCWLGAIKCLIVFTVKLIKASHLLNKTTGVQILSECVGMVNNGWHCTDCRAGESERVSSWPQSNDVQTVLPTCWKGGSHQLADVITTTLHFLTQWGFQCASI